MRTPRSAVIACRYVMARLRAAGGERWLGGLRRPPLLCRSTVPEVRLFAERRLVELPEAAARALCAWGDDGRPARLYDRALAPRALLELQARGLRCVSLLDEGPGLEFAVHDLCHLEKLVREEHYAEQVGFFALLDRAVDDRRWAELEAGLDEAWGRERDHVLADMNGAALFLYCGLRSRLELAARRRGEAAAERLGLLVALLGLEGDLATAALATSSRRTPPEASEPLRRHFVTVGAARLAEAGPTPAK